MSDDLIEVVIETPTNPIGRPQMPYDPEVGYRICELIAEGYSIRKALKEDTTLPSYSTIYRWLDRHEEFRNQYRKAREIQAHQSLDLLSDIIFDCSDDWTVTKDGTPMINRPVINRARLQCDVIRWQMGKLAPKVYGERQTVEYESSQAVPAVEASRRMSREEYEAEMTKRLNTTKALDTENSNSKKEKSIDTSEVKG